jgi:hypothetical protein
VIFLFMYPIALSRNGQEASIAGVSTHRVSLL